MTNEQEQKLKQMAEREYPLHGQANTCCGTSQSQPGLPVPMPSYTTRLRDNLRRAKEQAHRAESLSELQYLLDKHPDIARILDLLDEVKE